MVISYPSNSHRRRNGERIIEIDLFQLFDFFGFENSQIAKICNRMRVKANVHFHFQLVKNEHDFFFELDLEHYETEPEQGIAFRVASKSTPLTMFPDAWELLRVIEAVVSKGIDMYLVEAEIKHIFVDMGLPKLNG